MEENDLISDKNHHISNISDQRDIYHDISDQNGRISDISDEFSLLSASDTPHPTCHHSALHRETTVLKKNELMFNLFIFIA